MALVKHGTVFDGRMISPIDHGDRRRRSSLGTRCTRELVLLMACNASEMRISCYKHLRVASLVIRGRTRTFQAVLSYLLHIPIYALAITKATISSLVFISNKNKFHDVLFEAIAITASYLLSSRETQNSTLTRVENPRK